METKPTKTRNWFLTINQEAECFNEVIAITKNYEKCQYSLILHDKDNEEQPHYHLCILFDNARTFDQLQKKYRGAHIEIMESKYSAFRYLLHLDDTDKYQYEKSELIERGNNVEYYSTHDEYIKLDTESLLENIENGTIKTFIDSVRLFGVKQATTYRNTINQLLQEKDLLQLSYLSKTEADKLTYQLHSYENIIEVQSERINDMTCEIDNLELTNNKLLLRIRQLEQYEKIIMERGLL